MAVSESRSAVKPMRSRSAKSLSTQPVKAAGWLKSPELSEAMRSWSPDRVDFADGSRDHCKRLTRRLLKTEIGFISHPEFDQPGIGEAIFAEALGLSAPSSKQSASTLKRTAVEGVDQVGRLCEAKLLTPAQESLLFRRMNFLRHQAAVARAQLDPERPSRKAIEQVHRLIALADWHRDRIVEANTRLVFSIVKKFVNTSNSFDDLLSDGIVALMRAVEKFDFGRGFRFSTYATQVVRRGAYRQVMECQQERSKMQSGVEDLGLDVSDEGRQSAISEQRWHELRGRLSVMLGDLDRRERFIIRARFSLGSHRRVYTLQSLADRLGVSKERVRQLEQRAMEKLRSMAGEVGIAELET
ncbi:MAG: sigma-70 family RNA polymerase sigma factor [Planctomycetaceae bacterium]|nr:MAG: sigma-70 family RNA polymerase sigma factor [Planctomycetaceae bacterium]